MSTLTYKPVMWSRDGVIMTGNEPAFRYEVSDEQGRTVGYITNVRASSLPPCWKISRVKDGTIGESIGEYATSEEALSAFQKEFDDSSIVGPQPTEDGRALRFPQHAQKRQYGDWSPK